VSARWCFQDGRLEAAVDWSGFANVFYHATENTVMVSTSPLKLIAEGAPSEYDLDALAVFAHLGFFIEDASPFRGIRVLPPGGRLVWRNGSVDVRGQPPEWRREATSSTAAVERFRGLMQSAVRRCIQAAEHDVVVPLSGGRDSRHILLEMHAQRRPPRRCITLTGSLAAPDSEATAAGQLAAGLGVEHMLVERGPQSFASHLRTLAITHLCSDEIFEFISLREYAAANPCAFFDGLAGDILTRNKKFTHLENHRRCREGAFDVVAQAMFSEIAQIIRRPVDPASRAYKSAVEQVATTMARFSNAADPYTAFLFWNRTRREIALLPTRQLSTARQVFCPYLDPDLAHFLSSLPFEVTATARFHDDAIAAHYPAAAAIPYHDQLNVAGLKNTPLRKARSLAHLLLGLARDSTEGPWIMPLLIEFLVGRAQNASAVCMAQRLCAQVFDAPMSAGLARSILEFAEARDAR
jgi:hypothetical protein